MERKKIDFVGFQITDLLFVLFVSARWGYQKNIIFKDKNVENYDSSLYSVGIINTEIPGHLLSSKKRKF